MRNKKKIIIHADDFGISSKTNEGITYLFDNKLLSSCSLLANGHAFQHAQKILTDHPDYDVGAHLCITMGKPVGGNHCSLTDENGYFFPLKKFCFRYLLKQIRLEDIHNEWESQIQKTMDHHIKLSHIDSHHHVHAVPGLFKIAVSLCKKYNIKGIRVYRQSSGSLLQSLKHAFYMPPGGRSNLNGLCCPDNIVRMTINSTCHSNAFALYLIQDWNGVRELVCHPGFFDEKLKAIDSYVAERQTELNLLDTAEVRNSLSFCDLISYRDIGEPI